MISTQVIICFYLVIHRWAPLHRAEIQIWWMTLTLSNLSVLLWIPKTSMFNILFHFLTAKKRRFWILDKNISLFPDLTPMPIFHLPLDQETALDKHLPRYSTISRLNGLFYDNLITSCWTWSSITFYKILLFHRS